MLAKLRHRLTYANVTATIALFAALSTGGAYAANTVFSTDIVDGEVKLADIGAGAVASSEVKDSSIFAGDLVPNSIGSGRVADGSLTGTDVGDNSLVGADIDESTLFNDNSLTGTDVQESSLFGVNADKVDGGDLCRTGGVLTVTHNNSFSTHTVCNQGALRVEAICAAASANQLVTANLRLDTSANNSFYGLRAAAASQDSDFDAADSVPTLTSADDNSLAAPGVASPLASFYAGTPAGAQLSGTAGARATLNGDGSGTCDFVVGAIG